MPHDNALVDELVAEIQTYLDVHPDAADTLEGVVQWWIVHQRFLRGIEATAQALDRLVAIGSVEAVPGADGKVLYRAARVRPPGSAPAC